MNEELKDLLGRVNTVNVSLDTLRDNITRASEAMGKAVAYVNGKMDKTEASEGSSAEVDKLNSRIAELTDTIKKLEDMVINLSGGVDDEIEKRKEIIKQIRKDLAQAKWARRAGKKNADEVESLTKRLQKVQSSVLRSLPRREPAAAAAAAGARAVGSSRTGGATPVGGGGGGGRRGGGGFNPDFNPEDAGREGARRLTDDFAEESKKRLASWMTEISSLLIGGYGDIGQVLFAGSVRDITDFRREARSMAFELEGIGSSARGMQAEFADMGEVARQTGKSMDVMQKLYMANMRKGFKNQGKELKSVLKSGMFMSTMIGSNAEETGTMFSDWNRTLGMSVDMMAQLADDAKNIAKSTGLSGDELLQAMKSSEGILKNLRNQGNLTSAATKNVIQAMTMAKKLGIEDKASGVLDMMTSTNKFLEGDDKTRNFILKMVGNVPGGTDAALQGNLMNDPEMLKGMINNINSTISDFTGGAAKTVADMDKLSADQKMVLSRTLGTKFGMEMYEIKGIFDVFSDQTKSLADRFGDLSAESKNVNESMEKRKLAEQKMTELMVSSGMTFANRFTDAARKEKDRAKFGDAVGAVGASMTDAEKRDLMQMKEQAKKTTAEGGLGMSDSDFARTAGLGASKDYVDSLLIASEAMKKKGADLGKDVKDFGPELLKAAEKAQRGGGSGDLVSLVDEMRKVGNELDVDAKANADPINKLNQEINKLNETIRKMISGPLGILIDGIGWMGLALAQVGLAVGVLYLRMGSLTKVFSYFAGLGRSIGLLGDGVEKSFGSMGNLTKSFDDFARHSAVSRDVSEGFFKKFMTTYSNSRNPSRFMDIAEYRKLRSKGLSPMDAKKSVEKMGGFAKKRGVLGSLNEAFAGLRDDMLNGLSRMRKGIGGFFKSFLSETGRFFNVFRKSIQKSFKLGFSGGFLKSLGKTFSGGPIRAVGKAFSTAMKSGEGTRKILHMVSGAVDALTSNYFKYLKVLRTSSPLLAHFVHNSVLLGKAFATLNFGKMFVHFGKAMVSGFNIFKTGMTKGFSAVRNIFKPSAWTGLFKAGSKGLRAAILGGSLGTAQIIFSAIDMVFGAVSGFMNTGKNFEGVMKAMGKSTKDMTWGMYASSTVAGALVGILDGLTFGLLGMTGATKWLNETLSLVFYTIFSIVEGIVDGIMGAFKMVGSAFSYIGQQFKDIGDSLLGVFNSIAGIFGVKAGNWSEAFAVLYPYLKKIGTVIGYIVGTPLAAMLWLLVKGISAALVPIQMLINAFAGVIKIIVGFVNFFKEIFTVGFGQATKNLFGVILNSIYGVFKPMVDFFKSLANDIMAPFRWLWDTLVGHSIIPDLCVAIVSLFGKMAMSMIKTVVGLPVMLAKGLYNTFFKGPKKVFEKMFKHINTKTLKTGMMAVGDRLSGFFGLFKDNLSKISGYFKSSWFDFINTSTGGLFGKMVDSIKNSRMYKIVDDFLVKPISEGLSWIGSKASSVFKGAFDWIKGKVSSLIPGVNKGAAATSAVAAAGKATNPFANMSGSMGKAAAKTAATATDDVVKAAASAAPVAKAAAGGAAAAAMGGADEIASAAPKALGFLGKSSKLMSGLARKLPIVGPALDFGIRTMGQGQSLGKATAGTAAGAAGGIGGAALGATIGTGIGALLAPLTGGLSIPAGMWLGGLLGGVGGGVGAGMASDALYDKAFGKGEKASKAADAASEAMEQKSNIISTPVGQHAVPMLRTDEGGVSNVQPMAPGDVEYRLRREKAEGEAKSSFMKSPALETIEKVSQDQYAETQRMREVMELIASYLKPSSSKIGSESEQGARSNSTRKHIRPNVYGQMKDGKPGSGPNRSVYKN